MSKNGKNGHDEPKARGKKIRVAIVGVGNCASSLVQGRYYYENAKAGDFVPGLMHVQLGDYHISDVEFVAAFDVDKEKVGKDLSEAIFSGQNNTYKFMDVPHLGVKVDRGMTHDGLGKYLSQIIEKAPGPTADVVGILREREVDLIVSYLPVGSEEATKWYVEQALKAGVGFVNAIPVFIGREPYWQRRFAEEGLPGHRRRHQEPGRRDDHAPRADPPVHGPRRAHRPHVPAELRRQHRLPEHARARAPRVQEDQQDQRGHLDARLRDRRREHPRRPVGLRAVAQGPQVVPHPDRGHDVRRRPAQRRAQARGLGQPEQRRRHHRRDPLPADRPRPRPQGHARGAVELLHEEPAAPDPRRHRAPARRGVHPGRGQRDARRQRGVAQGRQGAGRPWRRPRPPPPGEPGATAGGAPPAPPGILSPRSSNGRPSSATRPRRPSSRTFRRACRARSSAPRPRAATWPGPRSAASPTPTSATCWGSRRTTPACAGSPSARTASTGATSSS